MKVFVTLFSIFGLALAVPAQLQIGQPAPDFTVPGVSGKTVKLSDYKGKIVVLEAFDSGCPWSIQEYQSGAMQELQRQVASNGVVWLVLDPWVQNPLHPRQTTAEARRQWDALKMNITDWLIDDRSQSLCKRYGVRVTPQMFVIDRQGLLAYSGAIDDVKTLAGDRRTARNYVREAVNELLAGKKVSIPHVKPIGCMIMYPGMSQFQLMRPMN